MFQHLASTEEVALRNELGEYRGWWLLRVLKLSDSWMLSSRQDTQWPPVRLRDHCGREGRNNRRVGNQRGGLRSAVFRGRCSHCPDLAAAVATCTTTSAMIIDQGEIQRTTLYPDYLFADGGFWERERQPLSSLMDPQVSPSGPSK